MIGAAGLSVAPLRSFQEGEEQVLLSLLVLFIPPQVPPGNKPLDEDGRPPSSQPALGAPMGWQCWHAIAPSNRFPFSFN